MTENYINIPGYEDVQHNMNVMLEVRGLIGPIDVSKELFFKCLVNALATENLIIYGIRDGKFADIVDEYENFVEWRDPRHKRARKLLKKLITEELSLKTTQAQDDVHYAPFWWPFGSDMR